MQNPKDTATIARELQKREEKSRARMWFVIIILMWIIVILATRPAEAEIPIAIPLPEHDRFGAKIVVHTDPTPLSWPDNRAEIYHNATGSPLSNDQAEGLIRYMSWSWSQRTGLQIVYSGLTNETEIPGAIVVQWANILQILEDRGSLFVKGYTAYKYWPSRNELASARLVLLSNEWRDGFSNKKAAHTAIHELGHSIGINKHSENEEAVMFFNRTHDRYAITAFDVQLTAYEKNTCHAELTPHGNVYIPAINGAGVTLKPVDGILTIEHEHHTGLNCSGSWNGSEAVIYDVRGIDGSFHNVRLKPVDGGFEIVGYE